jgi:aerobic-type carbon monoxide dehydrogenase small subunit (CoxS/CutS family)
MTFQVGADERARVDMTVNDRPVTLLLRSGTLLVDAIRDELGLTGTHVGCRAGDCGACTLLLDGRTVKSCLELAVAARGASIRTVEGLGSPTELHQVQQAFDETFGYQCGYCLPGMLLCANEAMEDGATTDDELRQAIDGNLCRCTGYVNILAALRQLTVPPSAGAGAPAE